MSGFGNLLGTPDTNFRGRRTLMALRVRRSTPSSGFPVVSLEKSSGERMVMYLQVPQAPKARLSVRIKVYEVL